MMRPVPWKLTIRTGPRVERARFAALDDVLAALDERVAALSASATRGAVDVKVRRFEPVQQVTARLEFAGPQRLLPSVRAGIDIRGDGSAQAYRGRVRREVIEQRKRETAIQALRRELKS
jgi:hypothetical protein